ncbi:transmembrane protein 230 [Marchantia polymorpha subsp. ruderalis]|nr:hypothetical protein MARPO_0001s0441 [Marchantia polymorpha]BBM99403.1 hypothetical protein Mp_1g21060 [Marchantia polymorpha subsp. ruderalis]|eukprot:PTQ50485.1 hypothetical protein MARPO_0001s0441 [Marchantia polymorpha]
MTERSRAHVRYAAVPSREEAGADEDGARMGRGRGDEAEEKEDLRFNYVIPDEVPFKSIALAIFLLALGSFFLSISHFLFSGHMPGDSSQAYGFLFLGVLVFLPGFYETRIAYYSWRGFNGYSFSKIPAY